MNPIPRETFVHWIAEQLDVDEGQLDQLTFADIGCDSLQLFEIDLLVEELGALLDEEEFAMCTTIHDVYDAYTRQVAGRRVTGE